MAVSVTDMGDGSVAVWQRVYRQRRQTDGLIHNDHTNNICTAMSTNTGLILSGGGARAAYQVGVIAEIARMQLAAGVNTRNPFDVICGTSAGAINAATLACGADRFQATVSDMVEVWRNFQVEQVYTTSVSGMLSSGARWVSLMSLGWLLSTKRWRPRSLLDNQPLAQLLRERIDFERLPDLLRSGALKALAITASSYGNGEHVTFFDSAQAVQPWTRNQRVAHASPLTHEHLLASSAIPFVFPATALHGPAGTAYFGDGSMRQTAPISPAIHLGADRVLVIGAGRMIEPTAPRDQAPTYPSLAHIAGHALSSIFLDALAVDVERLRRINQTLSLIPPDKRAESHLRPVDLLVISPSQRLDHIATQHAHALPATVKSLLRTLGSNPDTSGEQGQALVSYLLFESGYTQALMALGQADAQRQSADIHRFFGWPSPS